MGSCMGSTAKSHRGPTVAEESLTALFDKLSRKAHTGYHGQRIGTNWLKYEWSGSVWNLDDGTPLSATLVL